MPTTFDSSTFGNARRMIRKGTFGNSFSDVGRFCEAAKPRVTLAARDAAITCSRQSIQAPPTHRVGLQRLRGACGFSLVEVVLAVAVVAIGVVGILALFPLGMDAVRKAADDTQMMAIGQDCVAYYQQMAADSSCYSGYPTIDYTKVIDPASTYGSYSSTQQLDGIHYIADCTVLPNGFSTIATGTPSFNMITRVQIAVYRTTGPQTIPPYKPMTNAGYNTTHYYFTEVDRYVQ